MVPQRSRSVASAVLDSHPFVGDAVFPFEPAI